MQFPRFFENSFPVFFFIPGTDTFSQNQNGPETPAKTLVSPLPVVRDRRLPTALSQNREARQRHDLSFLRV